MTGQMHDQFLVDDTRWLVCALSNGPLFDPSQHGLEPVAPNTACYRGYWASFGLRADQLVLERLDVHLDVAGRGVVAPHINGVAPKLINDEARGFDTSYAEVGLPLAYSGGVIVGDGLTRGLYVHMGFQQAWKFERVAELTFKEGHLQQRRDLSDEMRRWREQLLEQMARDEAPNELDIRKEIERSFEQNYEDSVLSPGLFSIPIAPTAFTLESAPTLDQIRLIREHFKEWRTAPIAALRAELKPGRLLGVLSGGEVRAAKALAKSGELPMSFKPA